MILRIFQDIKVNKVGYLSYLVFFGLVGCQINFDAESLIPSDLISSEPHSQEQSISLPMTIEFQR